MPGSALSTEQHICTDCSNPSTPAAFNLIRQIEGLLIEHQPQQQLDVVLSPPSAPSLADSDPLEHQARDTGLKEDDSGPTAEGILVCSTQPSGSVPAPPPDPVTSSASHRAGFVENPANLNFDPKLARSLQEILTAPWSGPDKVRQYLPLPSMQQARVVAGVHRSINLPMNTWGVESRKDVEAAPAAFHQSEFYVAVLSPSTIGSVGFLGIGLVLGVCLMALGWIARGHLIRRAPPASRERTVSPDPSAISPERKQLLPIGVASAEAPLSSSDVNRERTQSDHRDLMTGVKSEEYGRRFSLRRRLVTAGCEITSSIDCKSSAPSANAPPETKAGDELHLLQQPARLPSIKNIGRWTGHMSSKLLSSLSKTLTSSNTRSCRLKSESKSSIQSALLSEGGREDPEGESPSPKSCIPQTDRCNLDENNPQSKIPPDCPLAQLIENGRFQRTFDNWRLIGRGGFGSVYRVQHKLEPDRTSYALKLVECEASIDGCLQEGRSFREVATNRDLLSKYVVRYFTWWCEEPQFLPQPPKLLSPPHQHLPPFNREAASGSHDSQDDNDPLFESRLALEKFQSRWSVEKVSKNEKNFAQPVRKNLAALARELLNEYDSSSSSSKSDEGPNSSPFAVQQQSKTCEEDSTSETTIKFRELVDKGFGSNHPLKHESDSDSDVVRFEASAAGDTPTRVEDECSVPHVTGPLKSPSNAPATTAKCDITLVIQMEWCSGPTLRQWLDRKDRALPCLLEEDPCNVRRELVYFKQMMKGIRDIHKQGIVHRDIKPENVFVDHDTLKIGDFGLSKLITTPASKADRAPLSTSLGSIGQIAALRHTFSLRSLASQKGVVIGTPSYAAPEGGANCTEKADIYSAALVLLELLSHKVSTGHERHSILSKFRLQHELPSYFELPPFGGWKALILEMGSNDPRARPAADTILQVIKFAYENQSHRGFELNPDQVETILQASCCQSNPNRLM